MEYFNLQKELEDEKSKAKKDIDNLIKENNKIREENIIITNDNTKIKNEYEILQTENNKIKNQYNNSLNDININLKKEKNLNEEIAKVKNDYIFLREENIKLNKENTFFFTAVPPFAGARTQKQWGPLLNFSKNSKFFKIFIKMLYPILILIKF